MKKPWHGIMKIIEVQHVRDSKVIWEEKNVYNMLHTKGEEFFLKCCFNNTGSYPPANYYIGLDNRTVISTADTITELTDEPASNGYARQAASSTTGFTVQLVDGVYQATSGILSFYAINAGWGPVCNIFLASNISSGVLLATAKLSGTVSLSASDTINMRMSLSLVDTMNGCA